MPQVKQDGLGKRNWSSLFRRPSESLHLYFLFLSLPLVIFLAVYTPPFLSPDEPWHFARAYQLAGGKILGGDGGYLDEGILQLWAYVSKGKFPPDVQYNSKFKAGAEAIPWTGHLVFYEFPSVAQYPPTGYLPQACGVALGKLAGIGIAQTLILARLFNGITAVFICTLALFWCRAGKVLMFTVLLLPMSLCLFASASQDAALIAFSALAFALISRQLSENTRLSRGNLALLLASFLVISLGRPPYAALTLVFFTPGLLPRWRKVPSWLFATVLIGVNASVVVAWWLYTLSRMHVFAHPNPQNGQFSASLQLLNLMHHPEISFQLIKFFLSTLLATLGSMIGVIGWRSTMVPLLYYPAMLLLLVVALIAECVGNEKTGRRSYPLIFPAFAIAAFAIYFIQYLIWTPIGATVIYSVQGRYLLPLAVAVGLGIHGYRQSSQTHSRLTVVVLAAQVLTCICLPYSIYVRFYVK